MEHAHAFEPIQDGRIHIEKINGPFLFGDKGTPAEYSAGLDRAVAQGWLELHESGTCVKCIGRHAAIGAGSVVTRDIPANCLADGNPARVVRRFVGVGSTALPERLIASRRWPLEIRAAPENQRDASIPTRGERNSSIRG
jgi:hypothetical protein